MAAVFSVGPPFVASKPPRVLAGVLTATAYQLALQAVSSPLALSARSSAVARLAMPTITASALVVHLNVRAIQAVTTPIAAAARSSGVLLQAIAAQIAATARAAGIPLQALAGQISTVSRSVGKRLAANASQATSVAAGHVGVVALQALAAQVSSALRLMGKTASASLSVVASGSRVVGKSVLTVTTPTALASRSSTRALAASSAPVAFILARSLSALLQAAVTPIASASAVAGGLLIQAFVTPIAVTRRSVVKHMQAVGSCATTSVIPKLKAIAATCHPVASVKVLRAIAAAITQAVTDPIGSALAKFFARVPPQKNTTMGFPQRGYPFVDPKTGLVNETWFRFLQALWLRTGGNIGN